MVIYLGGFVGAVPDPAAPTNTFVGAIPDPAAPKNLFVGAVPDPTAPTNIFYFLNYKFYIFYIIKTQSNIKKLCICINIIFCIILYMKKYIYKQL